MSIFKDVKEDAVQNEETKDDLFTVVSEEEQDDVDLELLDSLMEDDSLVAPEEDEATEEEPAEEPVAETPAETAAASKGLNFIIAVLLFYDQLFDKISLEDISRHSLCSPCPSEKMMLLRFVLWRLISRAWLLI